MGKRTVGNLWDSAAAQRRGVCVLGAAGEGLREAQEVWDSLGVGGGKSS